MRSCSLLLAPCSLLLAPCSLLLATRYLLRDTCCAQTNFDLLGELMKCNPEVFMLLNELLDDTTYTAFMQVCARQSGGRVRVDMGGRVRVDLEALTRGVRGRWWYPTWSTPTCFCAPSSCRSSSSRLAAPSSWCALSRVSLAVLGLVCAYAFISTHTGARAHTHTLRVCVCVRARVCVCVMRARARV